MIPYETRNHTEINSEQGLTLRQIFHSGCFWMPFVVVITNQQEPIFLKSILLVDKMEFSLIKIHIGKKRENCDLLFKIHFTNRKYGLEPKIHAD